MSQTKAQLVDPVDGTIVNADINASAGIAGSKINPVFTSNIEIQNNAPGITFTDGDQDNDFYIQVNSGVLNFVESQTSANRIAIDSNSNVTVTGNLIVNSGYLEMQSQSIFIIDTIAHAGDTDTKIRFPSNDVISFETAGADRFAIGTSEVVVNDPGNSIDFRVEGDTEPNLLFVDASADKVSIGTSVPSDVFDVVHAANTAAGISIRNTNNSQGSAIAQLLVSGGDNAKGRVKIETNGAFHTIDEDSNGNLIIEDNGTERLRLDSSGFIQQQFTSDNSTTAEGLFINNKQNTTGNNASLIFSNDSGERKKAAIALIDTGNYGAGDLAFALDGADSGALHLTNDEKMRIDIAGRLLVGGSSSVTAWTQQNRFQVQGGTWDDAGAAIIKLGGNNNSPNLMFAAGRGTSPGTAVQDGDFLGYLNFNGDDGTDIATTGAFIRVRIDGTVASNRLDTHMAFATHHNTSVSEGMRIHPTGEVTIPSGVTLGTAIDNHGVNNTLDDYEEGTYVPTIAYGLSNAAYSTQVGHYTKVGRLVRFDFFIQLANPGGTSDGTMFRVTIPFVCDTTGTHRGYGIISYMNTANTNVAHTPALYIGANYGEFYAQATSVSAQNGINQSNAYFIGGGTFHTAS